MKRKKDKPEWIQIPSKVSKQPEYANLITGSVHQVIPPPVNRRNGNGVWVMGVTRPVKVFDWEYREYYPINVVRKRKPEFHMMRKQKGFRMKRKK